MSIGVFLLLAGTLIELLTIIEAQRRGMSSREHYKGGMLASAMIGITIGGVGLILVLVLGT